nr:hypothetical protein [uncultured Brevundimonas sp.]
MARSAEEAAQKAEEVGYPVVLRPSYVLGGRGMDDRPRPRAAGPLRPRGHAGVGFRPIPS